MDMSAASASRIKTNKQCEMKYFLEYHLKIPETKKGNIYTHKGSAVHDALEQWVNAVIGEEENAEIDYVKTLRDYYVKHRLWLQDIRKPDKGGDPYPQTKNCSLCSHMSKAGACSILSVPALLVDGCPRINYEQDLGLIRGAIKSQDYPVLALNEDGELKKKVIGVELKFDGEVDGVPLRAFLDLVVEEDSDTIEIIDYKTGNSMSYAAACKDPQVLLYGKIISQMFPQYKYVLVTLWFLKKNPVTVPITAEMNELTVKSLKKHWNQITENVSPYRGYSWLCKYCVGYDVCGMIRNKFVVDGQFRLPTISCRMADSETQCWGSLRVENPDEVTMADVDKMTYACRGHSGKSGKYVSEIPLQAD